MVVISSSRKTIDHFDNIGIKKILSDYTIEMIRTMWEREIEKSSDIIKLYLNILYWI